MSAPTGMWQSSGRTDAIPICEMSDRHLLNAVVYMRKAIHQFNPSKRSSDKHDEMVLKLAEVAFEAGQRQLKINWDSPPPNPRDFRGKEYERKSAPPTPLAQRPCRVKRSLEV